ncbi:PDZ domain-containing protein [Erysipelothrix sp. HDW6C]|uniref:S1C family serine protease n=1 Tax=Erysipelothrix sp. HDW6C TaxID=2714930 RepID=UPI0014079323|nr:trypsin-like peptidase domain-containing protein [Erysipelothrix sp. HDW6C]QIK70587.1 PDZ domain-containing protein [Erysipelothrix sp. HDW6C]
MKKGLKNGIIAIMVVLLGWNGYLTYEVYNARQNQQNVSNNGDKPSTNTTVEKVVSQMTTDVTKVADDVRDKVVSVINEQRGQTAGSGSGAIYKNENGKLQIITNHHVIDGNEKVYVQFSNGEKVAAKVIGSDPYTDLALLEVEADIDIEPFEIADSSFSKVGEFVVAVGSPMGIEFANSVTFGIISGKDRSIPVDLNNDGIADWDMVVMQTDAAINPGNSGGALVNMKGELIGINSMKLSSSNVEGMGFAIPINEVVPIIEQIAENGKVSYPIIGISAVSLEDLNDFMRKSYNIPDGIEKGVFIAEVTSGGPANKAGIKEGDILTKFGDVEVTSFKDFRRELYKHKVGETVEIEVNRDGKTMTISVTLEA